MKRVLKYALPALMIYALLTTALFVAMLQPPHIFGRVMSKLPAPVYFAFPFESMWLRARAGRIKVGDAAPDFTLKTAHGLSEVQLSSFRGQRPVMLIFGSHT